MKKIIFVVIIEEIYNQDMYDIYIKRVVEIIKFHHGEYIARSNKILPFNGYKPERSIVLGFDSIEEANKCFFSEEYEKIKHFRENSTKSKAFFIENESTASRARCRGMK
jgi:uncharacterized protein (DUF1330 family)